MKKINKFLMALAAAALFVGLFAVPAGEKITFAFVVFKTIDAALLCGLSKLYERTI